MSSFVRIPSLVARHPSAVLVRRRALCSARLARRTYEYLPDEILSARPVPVPPPARVSSIDELKVALISAGFTHLGAPEPLELNPPHAHSLPLRLRAAENRLYPLEHWKQSRFVEPWKSTMTTLSATSKVPADAAPTFHVFVRGVESKTESGMLFMAKLRALEVAYNRPIRFILRRTRLALYNAVSNTSLLPSKFVSHLTSVLSEMEPAVSHSLTSVRLSDQPFVRRSVPAGDPTQFLRITGAVEPIFKHVVVAYAPRPTRDRPPRWSDAKARLRAWALHVMRRAVNPAAIKPEPPAPQAKWDDLRVMLYADVPWGILHHMLPNEVQDVRLRQIDLYRMDALTLLGVGTVVFTVFRYPDSPLLLYIIGATIGLKATQIGWGLQSALSGHKARIFEDKFRHLVARGSEAVRAIHRMALENQKVESRK